MLSVFGTNGFIQTHLNVEARFEHFVVAVSQLCFTIVSVHSSMSTHMSPLFLNPGRQSKSALTNVSPFKSVPFIGIA